MIDGSNSDESSGNYAEQKKKKNPITNVYILYNSIYITLLKRQNFGNEQITDYQGLVMVIKGSLWWSYSYLGSCGRYINSSNCTEQNTHREREQWVQQVKPGKSEQNLWIISMSISWLWYCTSFARQLSRGEMVTGTGCLSIIFYNCIRLYNYFNKNLNKKRKVKCFL